MEGLRKAIGRARGRAPLQGQLVATVPVVEPDVVQPDLVQPGLVQRIQWMPQYEVIPIPSHPIPSQTLLTVWLSNTPTPTWQGSAVFESIQSEHTTGTLEWMPQSQFESLDSRMAVIQTAVAAEVGILNAIPPHPIPCYPYHDIPPHPI